MKLQAIRELVETQTIDALRRAEAALLEEQMPGISVAGEDAGEQLTHVLAAIWIKEYMDIHQVDYSAALRAYVQRVRRSIE